MFPNYRDVGGLPLVAGGETRPGVLLRSAAPLPQSELPELMRTRRSTVVDLRARAERPLYPWPTTCTVLQHNIFESAELRRLQNVDLPELYRIMMTVAAPKIVSVIEAIGPQGPTLIHCTAGKDRTGVTVAVILALVGVRRDAIVADYQRTQPQMAAVIDGLATIGAIDVSEVNQLWLEAPAEAIAVVLQTLTDHPGGPQGWYAEHGGRRDSVAVLRRRLCARPMV